MKSLSLSKPHVIIMTGVPGSGKTFFADKFAETFRAPYVSYDKIAGFLEDTSAANNLLQYQLDELLKTRQSIILEGGSDTRVQRSELARKARAAGYETLLVWVQTDPLTAKTRAIKEGKNAPHSISSPEAYDKALKHFTPPNPVEKPVVISGKHTYATQAKVVLKKLSAPRMQISNHTSAPVRSDIPGRRNITIR